MEQLQPQAVLKARSARGNDRSLMAGGRVKGTGHKLIAFL